MRTIYFFLLICFYFAKSADATFSIVAIDPSTGEVGSAGASCIANSHIINDPIGAIGAINTQAYFNAGNKAYAHYLMEQGLSPQEIIDSLVSNDAQGNPTIRQYGIVDLVGGGRSAAYTGINTTDWKGHLTGTTYAIQGNILLGPEILDSMEFIFNIAPGPLSDRLMLALEAAKVIGADTRCLSLNKSTISAYIHVVLPDSTDFPYLIVANTPTNVDPIDSLRVLYDAWKDSLTGVQENEELEMNASKVPYMVIHPNPFSRNTTIRYFLPDNGSVSLKIYDITGQLVTTVLEKRQESGIRRVEWNGMDNFGDIIPSGIYFTQLVTQDGQVPNITLTRKMIVLR